MDWFAFLISMATVFILMTSCRDGGIGGPGDDPGPNPDECEIDPESCEPPPPPPPPDVTLNGFTLTQTDVFDQSLSTKIATDGQTYLFGRANSEENAIAYDKDGNRIDSASLGVLITVNALFPKSEGYLVSTNGRNQQNEIIGVITDVNNAAEIVDLSTNAPIFFADGVKTASGKYFVVWGEVTTDVNGFSLSSILVAEILSDLTLSPSHVVRTLNEEISVQSLKIAAFGNKLLIGESFFTSIFDQTLFLYDIVNDTTLDILIPVQSGEQLAQLTNDGDGFVIVTFDEASENRNVRFLKSDSTFRNEVVIVPPGTNLVPIQGGYLNAFARDRNDGKFDAVLQRLDDDGSIKEELAVLGSDFVNIEPSVIVLDTDHLLMSWQGFVIDSATGDFVSKTFNAFLVRE